MEKEQYERPQMNHYQVKNKSSASEWVSSQIFSFEKRKKNCEYKNSLELKNAEFSYICRRYLPVDAANESIWSTTCPIFSVLSPCEEFRSIADRIEAPFEEPTCLRLPFIVVLLPLRNSDARTSLCCEDFAVCNSPSSLVVLSTAAFKRLFIARFSLLWLAILLRNRTTSSESSLTWCEESSPFKESAGSFPFRVCVFSYRRSFVSKVEMVVDISAI